MADVIAASEARTIDEPGAPAARARFEAPTVEDLGRLQALTQFQISVPLPP